jgi:hypothetical protein
MAAPQPTGNQVERILELLQMTAQDCISLARDWPHAQTSLGLPAIAGELMAKADELRELYGDRPSKRREPMS